MYKAYKYRIYPTPEQKAILAQHFGNVRWFWNFALNKSETTYRDTGKGLSRNAIQKTLLAKVIFNEIKRATITKTLCFGD
jgi:putative transposase